MDLRLTVLAIVIVGRSNIEVALSGVRIELQRYLVGAD